MTRRPEILVRLLLALGAAGVIAWLVMNTEWVDIETPRPLPEELRKDGTLLAREYLQMLGLKARRVDDLIELPPTSATLVLTAGYWNLIDGSSRRLQRWVQDGGHLLVDARALLAADDEAKWLPLRRVRPPDADPTRSREGCRVLKPHAGLAQAEAVGYVACLFGRSKLIPAGDAMPTWQLDSEEHGAEVLRMPLGQGRVTGFAEGLNFEDAAVPFVIDANQPVAPPPRNFGNRGMVAGDNAALLAALVDARPGREVWFVTRIERPPLPLWLWQQAWPALALAAVALLLALWRNGSRFGPLQQEPPPERRSLAAQIRASADFLFRHQPAALQAMARRALDEAAAQQVAGWRRLKPAERPAALARATGLPEARLAVALAEATARSEVADALAVLESARRALLNQPEPAVESNR